MNTKTYYQVTFMYQGKMHGDSYPGRTSIESAQQYIGKLIAAAQARGFKFQNLTVRFNEVTVLTPSKAQ